MTVELDKLDREDYKELKQALIAFFPKPIELRMFAREELEENIYKIAGETLTIEEIAFELIEWAESKGNLKKLLICLCQYKPDNKVFKKICKKYFPYSTYNNNILSIEYLTKIKGILDSIDFEILKYICQLTIKSNFKNPDLANLNSINSIAKKLLEGYPERKQDNIPIILEFVQRLIDYHGSEIDNNTKQNLSLWLREVGTEKEIVPPINYIKNQRYNQKLICLYLLIVVEEIDEGQEFSLSAEIVPQYQNDRVLVENEKIDLVKQGEKTCFYDKLKENIIKIINDSPKIISEKYTYFNEKHLIIELFLPHRYIDNKIDLEEIIDSGNQLKPIGYKYCFIIRCTERYQINFFSTYGTFLEGLKDRWKILQNFCDEECDANKFINKLEYLSCIEKQCNWEKLLLNWNRKEMASVNLTCKLPQDDRKNNFFLYLLKGAVPISLWNRNSDLSCKDIEKKFNKIINLDSFKEINKLYQAVHKLREDAHVEGEERASEFIGYHLGFLCDHPNRIPATFNNSLESSD